MLVINQCACRAFSDFLMLYFFLPFKLQMFVQSTCDKMVQAGRLEAVLLTGFSSSNFIELVQQYLDRSGDVQTAAILGLHACALNTVAHHTQPQQQPAVAPTTLQGEVQQPQPTSSNRRNFRYRPPGSVTQSSAVHTNSAAVATNETCIVVQLGGQRLANWVQR